MTALRAKIFAYVILMGAGFMAPFMMIFVPAYNELYDRHISMSIDHKDRVFSNDDGLAGLQSAKDVVIKIGIFFMAYLLLVLGLANYMLSHFILNPVSRLNAVISQLAHGKYNDFFPARASGVLEGLADSVGLLKRNMQTVMESHDVESIALNNVLMELQASEVRSKGIFNGVQDGLIITDGLGMMKSVNPALCKLTGYRQAELLDNSVDILIPIYYRSSHQKKIVDFALDYSRRPNRTHMQLEVHTKDGDPIPVEISLSQFKTANKHCIIAVVRDIRERLEAEQALRYERDRAQSYLDTAEVALISIDREGRVTLVNRKCLELLGFNEQELLGQDYFNLCPDQEAADEIRDAYFNHIINDDVFPKYFYINLRTKDGQERIFEWHNNTIKDYDSNKAGIILAGTDMTEFRRSIDERKKLRDQLHHSKKMEAVGRLSSGIAHDFNNILASVMGYTELLQDIMSDDDNETVNDYLKEIYASGERARDLIDNMLKYSRGVAKEDKGIVETLYLPAITNEVKSILREVLPPCVEVNVDIPHDAIPIAVGSFNLQQVIMNLSLNASDAMNKDGELLIKASNRTNYEGNCSSCSRSFKGDFLELSFTDVGTGIEQEILAHLFEPFFTTKTVGEVGKGAGMGLAVVHGIVHDAGGHIVVESTPGKGSTFRILFPMVIAQLEAMEA